MINFHFIFLSTYAHQIYRHPCAQNYQTRRDRTQRRTEAFEGQMSAMVEAYMAWMLVMKEEGIGGQYQTPPGVEIQAQVNIVEIGIFRTFFYPLLTTSNSPH